MKNIFLETHNIDNKTGGLGVFNYNLLKGISDLENENYLFHTLSKKPLELSLEFKKNFTHHSYSSSQRLPFFRIKKKYDLWHSLNQNTKIEPFFKHKNYVLTIHDVHFIEEETANLEDKRNKRFIQKLERANAITYISEYAKQQTNLYFKVPNVPQYVIHNGNPVQNIIDTTSLGVLKNTDKPYFYSIGDFIKRKNFESIINMMKEFSDFNLLISGNHDKEYGEKIKKLIVDSKISNRVFLTGKVNEIEKQYYLKNCTAFFFPSIREGFGLPPIEAMAFGKPVFLANKTSLPEIGGKEAYYWNDFDPIYMKQIVEKGLSHFEKNKPELEQLIIKRAQTFNWKIAAKNYLDVYKNLLF